jgi:transcriptional regulator with XRE-family HTH domain
LERESNSLLVVFAAKLKTLRNAKGWSQEALGKRLGYSGEMVSKVETGDARPSGQFAASCDLAFPEMGGMFADLVVEAENSHDVYPVWFRSWVDAEKRRTFYAGGNLF